MRKVLSFVFVTFVAVATALAFPVTIYTSCGIHNTDTELWGGMSVEDIREELEDICDQDQASPID